MLGFVFYNPADSLRYLHTMGKKTRKVEIFEDMLLERVLLVIYPPFDVFWLGRRRGRFKRDDFNVKICHGEMIKL